MKTNQSKKQQGFTLIEMIGVLAIVALLAAVIAPRIFAAIQESRFNNAVMSVNGLKTAAMDYYGKYGRFGDAKGVALASGALPSTWDQVLVSAGNLDAPFACKIGTSSSVTLDAGVASTVAVTGSNKAWDLGGSGSGTNTLTGSLVLYAVLNGVDGQDALELSKRLDGPSTAGLTEADLTTDDLKGRVKYTKPASAGAAVNVYIYLADK